MRINHKELATDLNRWADAIDRKNNPTPMGVFTVQEEMKALSRQLTEEETPRITVMEASKAVGVSKASLGRWIKIGRLPATKGAYGPTLVSLADVKEAIKNPYPSTP